MKAYIIALILTLIAGILFMFYATNEIKKNRVYSSSLPSIEVIMPIYYLEIEEYLTIDAKIATGQRTARTEPLASRGAIISLPLPKGSDGSFKAYEDYHDITRQTSKQWSLQQIATTDFYGCRKVGEYYCIAIGQFYSNTIGETFIIKLGDRTLKFIISDVKKDKDTIDRMYCKVNGSIIEFIVDSTIMTHEKLQALMAGKVLSIVREKN